MSIDTKSQREPVSENESSDWRDCWYPISFVQDLPTDRPYSVTLYDHRFVLFQDARGDWVGLEDRCPHRGARLSDGQLVEGRIECLYHGWMFGGQGNCVSIPQLLPDAEIPDKACVPSFPVHIAQNIVWLWPGDSKRADPALLPLVPETEIDNVHFIDFQMDLPYDQTFLIENVIDLAHIHVAHAGVKGGGHRHFALPLDFEVLQESPDGIAARFRSIGLDSGRSKTKLRDAQVLFRAPNTVQYQSNYLDESLCSGLVLYSAPLGRERCRLLYRAFSNFADNKERRRPRWLEHFHQVALLEQDMQVVVGQYEELQSDSRNLKDQWLPIRSSDLLVVKYRKWLDDYGQRLPFFQGWSSRRDVSPLQEKLASNRWTLHTRICESCRSAYDRLGKVRLWSFGGALLALLLAAAFAGSLAGWAALLGAITGIGIGAWAIRMRKRME